MSNQCSDCLWGDKCSSDYPCEFFTPLDDELDDEYIETISEFERILHRKEWRKYLEGFFE